ncbi:hypothetical protein BUALT_Bualt06G0072100 [Buddleja alternifolia]|uniref:PB1-like domain-containing protein n=1 Tax=Buddleja alternifolia TaxID=168488 RepID=A0AAV6XEV2_9LAMI|nr:hypothetical protein BUALT_Bualt06G0072100 [Buddleja alternifolia]
MDKSQSVGERRSESKVLVGQKRGIVEIEETSESSQKRVKMRDLDSVFRSEAQAGRGDVTSDSTRLDLNININNDAPSCVDKSNKLLSNQKEEMECNNGLSKSRGFHLDLNAEDISSSINDPFYPYKNYEHLKSRDDSECGSSVGPLDEKNSMRVWKGLKQNNFMSNPYGAVPIPKPRGRKKTNSDVMKRKIELAKKEQVDRFARVAAPSGLLNGLNPGIINHVRNSKQVHSIIEALVRSERSENRQSKIGTQDVNERRQMNDYGMFYKSINGVGRGNDDLYMGDTRIFSRMASKYNTKNEDDGLALKLSSSVTVASENTSCLSNEESGNLNSVTSLSLKAANVALQWLELLNQDIRGRLAALRRSKKRVRSVITTELPSLLSREFSSNSEKDSYVANSSIVCHPDQTTADAHSVRWNTMFGQMDKALSEEETHLENWLNQVKEMQLHCERGLYNSNPYHSSQLTGLIGNNMRSGEGDNSEKELAVRAAAASIYSTCNFLLSMENLPFSKSQLPMCCVDPKYRMAKMSQDDQMDDNYHDVEMWIGGKFVDMGSRLVYEGGKKKIFEDVDLDRFSLDDIFEMYTKCGGKCSIVDFYFKRPGVALEIGLRTINRHLPDLSIGEMAAAYEGLECNVVLYAEDIAAPI